MYYCRGIALISGKSLFRERELLILASYLELYLTPRYHILYNKDYCSLVGFGPGGT